VASRYWGNPESRLIYYGFRLAGPAQ